MLLLCWWSLGRQVRRGNWQLALSPTTVAILPEAICKSLVVESSVASQGIISAFHVTVHISTMHVENPQCTLGLLSVIQVWLLDDSFGFAI
jgi:hypothetical protein